MSTRNKTSRLSDLFATFESKLRIQNEQELYDINKHSEDVVAQILNCATDYHFINVNHVHRNTAAIDLTDEQSRVCVQVTSDRRGSKIVDTLNGYFRHEHFKRFDKVLIYYLKEKANPNASTKKRVEEITNAKLEFDIKDHLWDASTVLNLIKQDASGEKIDCVLSLMEREFGGGGAEAIDIHQSLRDGSQRFYSDLMQTGRFRYLNIAKQLLPQSQVRLSEPLVEMKPEISDVIPLSEGIKSLQCELTKHAVLVGEGGLGKTVSLLTLWKHYLNEEDTIPIFIALNEYNHADDKRNFVRNYIARRYLQKQHLSQEEENQLWYLLERSQNEQKQPGPNVLLLLDGFNELTADKQGLLSELNEWIERGRSVQIIAVSRSDMRNDFNWLRFHGITLTYLSVEKIAEYLSQFSNASYPSSPVLQQLITVPLNLTLYAATSEIIAKHENNSTFSFKSPATSARDLLWNYLEAQLIKTYEEGQGTEQVYYYKFALQHLLPFLGYEMERNGQFDLSEESLYDLVDQFYQQFQSNSYVETFFKAFPYYRGCQGLLTDLDVGGNPIAKIQRSERVKELLCQKLSILVQEEKAYRLLHQNFRDFLAALHIYQDILVAEQSQTIPPAINNRILPKELREYVGELAGEHHNKPLDKLHESGYEKVDFSATPLSQLLDRLRGRFDEEVKKVVRNVITIWNDTRGELSGADLSNLYLSDVPFSKVRCYRKKDDTYFSAKFDYNLVDEKDFLPHKDGFSVINNACYSPDGTKILYCANDRTIKEWSGEICQQVFINDVDEVADVCYSSDGKEVLSISDNNTINIWDVSTGERLRAIDTYSNAVRTRVITSSTSNPTIIVDALDETIRDWSIATKRCLQPLVGHSRWQGCRIRYSSDGKKLLAGSADGTIKEWSAETGECLLTIKGHTYPSRINSICYSPDESRILSCSVDGTVKEWSIDTQQCTFAIKNLNYPGNACYDSSGEKILFCCQGDGTIQEWSINSNERTQELLYCRATRVCYSPDEKKILSVGRPSPNNGYTIEWPLDKAEISENITNVVGLWIQGCSFRNLHADSKVSPKLFKQYGAVIN